MHLNLPSFLEQPFNFCGESIAAIMSFSCKDLWRVGSLPVRAKKVEPLASGYTDQFGKVQIELQSPGQPGQPERPGRPRGLCTLELV